MAGLTLVRANMACMSMTDWRTSRNTEPRKLSGSDSWKSSPLTMTRSPTVMPPWTIWRAASNMADISAALKMACCPKLSSARLVLVLSAAPS